MLRRLRWRFIGVAALSLTAVLLTLTVGINLFFRIQNDKNEDAMLRLIAEQRGSIPAYTGSDDFQLDGGPTLTAETPFDTRYFTAWVDADGQIIQAQMEHIRAVAGDEVKKYVSRAAAKGKTFGYVGQYRFYRCTDYEQTLYVFLDCFRAQAMSGRLLRSSAAISLVILFGAMVLVYLFSGRAIAPAVKSVERQQRFITDASHEIKTPVTVIGSYASLMLMDDPDNEWARTIEKETGRLSALVTDLVKLSRWDEEGARVSKERFSLSEALWDLLPTYEKLAAADGHAVETDIAEDVSVEGDEGAIQNAISVLLENAVKYAVPGSAITVTLEKKRRGAQLRVTNGCDLPAGLDPERLFDRFYRADGSRNRTTGGSGVGLSLARAIVEAYRGSVRAVRDGENITFIMELPA